ncbi:MAG: hypothetical protein ACKO1M_13450 [Planctomycetota bacterium]
MALKTMLIGRWLVLPLAAAHLLLGAAAVPHCHDRAAVAGPEQAADHPHHHGRPHRHWAWGGHGHAADDHAHGSPGVGDRRTDGPPLVPVDHDAFAIYPADAFLVSVAGPCDPAEQVATAWAAVPLVAAAGDAAIGPLWRVVRPPGDRRLPRHHDLLPHVLRV